MPMLAIAGLRSRDLATALSRVDPSLRFEESQDGIADVYVVEHHDEIAAIAESLRTIEHRRLFDRRMGGRPVWIVLLNQQSQRELHSQLIGFGRIEPIITTIINENDLASLSLQLKTKSTLYKHSNRQSNHSLTAKVIFASLMLLIIASSAIAAYAWAPRDDSRLATLVRQYQLRERSLVQRLSDARRPRVKAELQLLRDDAMYASLPVDLREFVDERYAELERYEQYANRFKPPQMAAGDCRSLDDFDRLTQDLQLKLSLSNEDAEAWAETEYVNLRRKWAIEIDSLRDAERTLFDWFHEQSQLTHRLLLSSTLDRDWLQESNDALRKTIPFDLEDPLPGSFELPVPGGEKLTYRTAAEFDRVFAASRELDATRERLKRLIKLIQSLDANEFQVLESPLHYALPEWGDPNRELIRSRIINVRDRLVRSTRAMIKNEWSKRETWKEKLSGDVAKIQFLLTLEMGQPAGDPLEELLTFIQTESWTIDTKGITIRMPEGSKLTPDRVIFSIEDKRTEWKLGEASDTPLTLKPGQSITFKAIGDREFAFVWQSKDAGSFDLFLREPLLAIPGESDQPLKGVIVIWPAWPRRPLLYPDP